MLECPPTHGNDRLHNKKAGLEVLLFEHTHPNTKYVVAKNARESEEALVQVPTFSPSFSTRVHTTTPPEGGGGTEEALLWGCSHSTKSFKTPLMRHTLTTTKSRVDHAAMVPWKER